MYILPTVLRPIFKLLLKSRALKDLITSPKIHSTEVRTRLMDKLKASIPGVKLPVSGPSRDMLDAHTSTCPDQLENGRGSPNHP